MKLPDVRALLQNYIEDPDSIVPYARLVNTENQFTMSMGTIEPDTFLERELDRGLAAAHAQREYSGDPLVHRFRQTGPHRDGGGQAGPQ